jgi:hypothetical protein
MRRRLTALVIGNADYTNTTPLNNPVNDAADISAKLTACGFTVVTKTNCTNEEMERALEEFKNDLEDNDVGLFFFAGHGMQVQDKNYLTAIDTSFVDEISAKHKSLPLNQVIEVMERGENASSIIILDACRNNPFEKAWKREIKTRGLAPVYAPKGTIVAYATSPGQTASDGSGRNGAYTAALLQHLDTPDCSIEGMFKRVRNSLSTATGGKQISWEHTSLSGEFFFNLSLGSRIDEYSVTSLRDKLFVIDDKKPSHAVIKALKSNNWYTQNPAIKGFTAGLADKALPDSLFVVGRNVYQAACGGSKGAILYLTDFMLRTAGMKPDRRKALLDGMLFEVFFDSDAQLRKNIKMGSFQKLFGLQQRQELKPSFDFIAECLLQDIARFYSLPGKNHTVVVDVVTNAGTKAGVQVLRSVHYGGTDIFWMDDPEYAPEPGEEPIYRKMNITEFEKHLAEEMVVSEALLTIKYLSFAKAGTEKIHVPYGWTTRKQQ